MKTLKKILFSSVSILGLSLLVWIVLLLNPSLSYANQTQISGITIFHNQDLEEGIEDVISNAIKIIKTSDIYDQNLNIQLCLNDDKVYPKLNPFAGATAYAFFNKTVIYASKPNFKENITEFEWAVNGHELRKYNLTRLLAHEFMHNVQSHYDTKYYITSTLGGLNWKLEGHAEYISREFKNDGLLRNKIALYQLEEKKEHTGIPVFILEDGTIQSLSYFKNSLVIQYMMEEKELNFHQICELEDDLEKSYAEMIEWSKN